MGGVRVFAPPVAPGGADGAGVASCPARARPVPFFRRTALDTGNGLAQVVKVRLDCTWFPPGCKAGGGMTSSCSQNGIWRTIRIPPDLKAISQSRTGKGRKKRLPISHDIARLDIWMVNATRRFVKPDSVPRWVGARGPAGITFQRSTAHPHPPNLTNPRDNPSQQIGRAVVGMGLDSLRLGGKAISE